MYVCVSDGFCEHVHLLVSDGTCVCLCTHVCVRSYECFEGLQSLPPHKPFSPALSPFSLGRWFVVDSSGGFHLYDRPKRQEYSTPECPRAFIEAPYTCASTFSAAAFHKSMDLRNALQLTAVSEQEAVVLCHVKNQQEPSLFLVGANFSFVELFFVRVLPFLTIVPRISPMV